MKISLSRVALKGELSAKIAELSEQNLLACYQCGKCAAGCPSIEAMDMLPSQVVRLAQMGRAEDALKSKAIWLCAACQTCKVRCPRGVDLPRVMEALRQIALRENGDYAHPNGAAPEDLAGLPQIALIASFRKHSS